MEVRLAVDILRAVAWFLWVSAAVWFVVLVGIARNRGASAGLLLAEQAFRLGGLLLVGSACGLVGAVLVLTSQEGAVKPYLGKVARFVEPYLEPGETVEAATWGASSLPGALIGAAQGCVVALTDRHVYVFHSDAWRVAGAHFWYGCRVTGVVAKQVRGAVAISLERWTLRVGDAKVVIHLHHRLRARRLVDLATPQGARIGEMR